MGNESQTKSEAVTDSGATPIGSDSSATTFTPEEFIERLRKALQRDGDFPASAKVVSELRSLVSDTKTTANQVAEVILREPSLGIRVLHLVNSSFYRRAKPIMTISQAVIQIGMKPLADLCSGLVLLQKFVPVARRGGAFANTLQQIVLTSLLTSTLSGEREVSKSGGHKAGGESGYLAGSLRELGTLLMAYYFPQVYETATRRAESKHLPLEQCIKEVIGLTPIQLSVELIDALNLPPMYKEIILASEGADKLPPPPSGVATPQQEIAKLGRSLSAANQISEVLSTGQGKAKLDTVLNRINSQLKLDLKDLNSVVGSLPALFKEHCSSIDLPLPDLPEFVTAYSEAIPDQVAAPALQTSSDQFSQFVDEIRLAVQNGEPTASIITSVMETLAWGLRFDRVILLLVTPGKHTLVGRMALGDLGTIDPRKIERPVSTTPDLVAPDSVAFVQSRPVFNGDSVLPDGWPLVAFPVGFGARTIGVIYADCIPNGMRAKSGGSDELSNSEQAALGVLAELLERSVRASK